MAAVSGWIFGHHLNVFAWRVSGYVDYGWDDLDDDALIGVLDRTDVEKDVWFEYPIVGDPHTMLTVAADVGSSVVFVRLSGAFDAVLSARFETLIDIYSSVDICNPYNG